LGEAQTCAAVADDKVMREACEVMDSTTAIRILALAFASIILAVRKIIILLKISTTNNVSFVTNVAVTSCVSTGEKTICLDCYVLFGMV